MLVVLACAGSAAAASLTQPFEEATQSLALRTHGFDGSGVTVAIIDTGVEPVTGLDGVVDYQQNLSGAGSTGDQYGHGTFVAGIVHELAPGARIISIKLSGADGAVDVTQVLAALQWVVANRGRYSIDVVNLSFGNDSQQSWRSSPLNFAVERAWDSGLVVVASAGNRGTVAGAVTKPGDDPVIITVGGSDDVGTGSVDDDSVAPFSSVGPTLDGLAKPDVVAPGTRIVSLRVPGSTIDREYPAARVGDDRFRGSGSSFAAPMVSGVVAQLLDAQPTLTPDQVKTLLMGTARRIDGTAAAQGTGTVRGGAAYLASTLIGIGRRFDGRSTGTGSLQGARGTARVRVRPTLAVELGVTAERTAMVAPDGSDTLLVFDQAEYLTDGVWDASRWGASQWGSSKWGAETWDTATTGSAEWWASKWG